MKRVLAFPFLLLLLAMARPAGAVCTAADVMACGHSCWSCSGNTCTLAKVLDVIPVPAGTSCTFDFGTRDVVLAAGGFNAGQNAFEIRANSLTVGSTGTLKATGNMATPGGVIVLTLGSGGFRLLGNSNPIDLTGAEAPGVFSGGGSLIVQSDGDVLIANSIAVDGTTTNAQGGQILITAGRYAGTVLAASGSITVAAGLTATAKATGVGGVVTLTANGGTIGIQNRIDVSAGGDGGDITTTSDGNTILSTTPTFGPLLVADGAPTGDAASGGCIDIFANGKVSGLGAGGGTGPILARGSNAFVTTNGGGCGGMVSLESGGPLTLLGGSTGGIDVSGGQLGGGGAVSLMTDNGGSDMVVEVPLSAGAAGLGSVGGCIDLCSNGSMFVRDDLDSSADCGGDVCLNALFSLQVAPPAHDVHSDGGGGVEIFAGGQMFLAAGPTVGAVETSFVPGSPGGAVSIAGNDVITAAGTIDVSAVGSNPGGSIGIDAGKDVVVPAGATINADGGRTGGVGGSIFLRAGDPDLPGNLTLSGQAHATGTSAPGTLGPALAVLEACNVHVGSTGLLDTRGDQLASNTLTARTGLTVDGGALIATTGVDPQSRNFLILPAGSPTPVSAAFSPTIAPGDVQLRSICTGPNQPPNCLTPCPVCGNGITEFPETCDNGASNGVCQPCSANCRQFSCDDGNPCTSDTCNPITGLCSHIDTVTPTCNDGNLCTTEACNPLTGQCITLSTVDCDDGFTCTTDFCNSADGSCSHVPILGCTTTTIVAASTSTTVTQPVTTTTAVTGTTTTTTGVTSTTTPAATSTTAPATTTTTTAPESTTTTSIVAVTSTSTSTTTTIPSAACTPATASVCDDGDPCTRDTCEGNRCVHEQLTGFDAVLCRLDGIALALQSANANDAGGPRLQQKLEAAVARARVLTTLGQGAQGKLRVKQLRRAQQKLTGFIRVVKKNTRAGKITQALSTRVLGLANAAMSDLTPLRTPG